MSEISQGLMPELPGQGKKLSLFWKGLNGDHPLLSVLGPWVDSSLPLARVQPDHWGSLLECAVSLVLCSPLLRRGLEAVKEKQGWGERPARGPLRSGRQVAGTFSLQDPLTFK